MHEVDSQSLHQHLDLPEETQDWSPLSPSFRHESSSLYSQSQTSSKFDRPQMLLEFSPDQMTSSFKKRGVVQFDPVVLEHDCEYGGGDEDGLSASSSCGAVVAKHDCN